MGQTGGKSDQVRLVRPGHMGQTEAGKTRSEVSDGTGRPGQIVCMYVCMYYNHGRSTSRVAITVQSQGQVKTDMQGQVTVITHMIQRSLTCRYPIYVHRKYHDLQYIQRAAFGRCSVLALAT